MNTHHGPIHSCPECNRDWVGRTVQDGADLIAEHMRQDLHQPDLFEETR